MVSVVKIYMYPSDEQPLILLYLTVPCSVTSIRQINSKTHHCTPSVVAKYASDSNIQEKEGEHKYKDVEGLHGLGTKLPHQTARPTLVLSQHAQLRRGDGCRHLAVSLLA